MRIHVKGDGHDIRIPIPNWLIFNRACVWLYLRFAKGFAENGKQYFPENTERSLDISFYQLPERAVYSVCAELMRIKRKRGSWELVEVICANGEEIHITL